VDVAAGITAGAKAIEGQRTAGSEPFQSTKQYTTPKKVEEAQKAHEFVAPVLPEGEATAFGTAIAGDGGKATSQSTTSSDDKLSSATQVSEASGSDSALANATSIAARTAGRGDSEAQSTATASAAGEDPDAEANSDATALAGSFGDTEADATANAQAFGSRDADADATADSVARGGFFGGDADATANNGGCNW